MLPKLLYIDDEQDNLQSLKRVMRSEFDITTTLDGFEALELIQSELFHIIISDQRMPDITGVEVLAKARELSPSSIRILLTGYSDLDSTIDAINKGHIYRYLTKPWDPTDMLLTLKEAAEKWQLNQEIIEKNSLLKNAYNELASLDKLKTDFMILVNHELKTPITSIMNYSEFLKNEQLNKEDQKKIAENISLSTKRLNTLVEKSLLFIKLQSKKIETELQNFDLTDLLHTLDLGRYHLKILTDEPLIINSDKRHLKTVLKELLLNGNEHGQGNSEHFELTIEPRDKTLRVTIQNPVKDHKGIDLDKIQKPFYTQEDMMYHSQGLGLGVAVSKLTTEAINGNFNILTEDGLFKVELDLPNQK